MRTTQLLTGWVHPPVPGVLQEAADFAAKLGGARRAGVKKGSATPAGALSPASAAKKSAKEMFESD